MQKRIIFVIILAAFFGVFGMNFEKSNLDVLRVAFPYNKKATDYEPTKIHLAPEYIFLQNIFSTAVLVSPESGEPMEGVAKKFYWQDNELHLEIRNDLKTVDGKVITAKDVEFSLKRLLVLAGNTHGNFKDLICTGDESLESVESFCSGIWVENNKVILKPKKKQPFLLPMLGAIDFAIIPKSSVNPKTLKIEDFRNTTGVYYVDIDDGKGNITLKINPHHFLYSKDIAQTIQLVPSGIDGHKNSVDLFEENKVDFISTIDKLNPEKVINFNEKNKSVLHSTMNIRTFVMTFTSKGKIRFNQEERLSIGKVFKKVFRDIYRYQPGYESTDQFFPAMGDGSLPSHEIEKIGDIYSRASSWVGEKKLHVGFVRLDDVGLYGRELEKSIPGITVEDHKNVPSFRDYKADEKMPDIIVGGPDTGFIEDIGLVSYSMNAGVFGYTKEKASVWLERYMNHEDKPARMNMLKALHYEVLSKALLVPLVSAPYVALARKPWQPQLSQIFGDNPFWLIKKK